MKELLESKKNELLSQLKQSKDRLNEINSLFINTEKNITALSGAIQVVDELINEYDLKKKAEESPAAGNENVAS